MAMAGLYDAWNGQYGEPLLTYTIITRASPGIRRLHARMPLIFSREDEEVWLDPQREGRGTAPEVASAIS